SGGSTVFDVFGSCSQLALAPLLFEPSLDFYESKALRWFCSSENCEPHCNVAGHILKPLDLAITKTPMRRCPPRRTNQLHLERELTGGVMVPLGKARAIEQYALPRVTPRRTLTFPFPGRLMRTF